MWQPGRVKEKHTKVVNNIATEGKEMTTGGQNLLKLDCQDWVEKVRDIIGDLGQKTLEYWYLFSCFKPKNDI